MKPTVNHHHVKAEWQSNQDGPVILLTQQGDYSEPNTVLLHPWQLRALCEHFELVKADLQSERAIATLQRRMMALRDRIDELCSYMANFSDHKHADLSHELNTINLLSDLANEWCADFKDTPIEASATAAKPARGQPTTPTQAPLL